MVVVPVGGSVVGGGSVGSGPGSPKLNDGSISLNDKCLIVKSAFESFDFILKCSPPHVPTWSFRPLQSLPSSPHPPLSSILFIINQFLMSAVGFGLNQPSKITES